MISEQEIDNDHKFTILFVAPFYNRSGFAMGARALVKEWTKLGIPIKIISVDEIEEGIDDFDLTLLKGLEETSVIGTLVAIFYHVPSQSWLDLTLPPGSIRIMFTTFDGILHGETPPNEWLRICNNMDLVFLNELEIDFWIRSGLNADLARPLIIPHIWLNNQILQNPNSFLPRSTFRFLTIAMFQPRRRWDTLIEAFLEEFADDEQVELYIKVNYPSWHPHPGQPQADLEMLVSDTASRIHSKARVIVDDNFGTRLDICDLIDSASCYVSTDTAPTGPVGEGLIRGKKIVMPRSIAADIPDNALILIDEDPNYKKIIDDEIIMYQPHHRGKTMPLLHVADVRVALRTAFEDEIVKKGEIWNGWNNYIATMKLKCQNWNTYFINEIIQAIKNKKADFRINLCWEGSQFVYHSLAHVNRQLCLLIGTSNKINLRIMPYEKDQFDPYQDLPAVIPLIQYVKRPLDRIDVHLRHQWPPNFTPPENGAWIMIQPWEFGGIPNNWLIPMRDLVDEIWVPTSWVRDCYIKSGIPGEKVQVVPNGVDSDVFSPSGPKLRLKTEKSFRFLFLGGTIARKGIDIVLEAYLQTFSASDDVCLVIKGQPGAVYQGSEIDVLIESIQRNRPNAPEIEYTNIAFTEAEMAALYRSCDVLVHPYRGEGFGLPIAEAMSSGLPVIVTKNGAARDFTDESFAYLISSQPKSTKVNGFEPTAPGFWLEEPNVKEVAEAMRKSFLDRADVKRRGQLARDYAEKNLSWEKAAVLATQRIEVLSKIKPCRLKKKKTGFVYRTDWKSRDWVEILVSYISEFVPGEPVSLIFPIGNSNKHGGIDATGVLALVMSVLNKSGRQEFPDIVVTDELDEWLDLQKSHDLQFVDPTSGSTIGLDGVMGQRLGRARLFFVAAIR